MENYAQFLRELLAPLGVYDLTETSVSGAAICALGQGLDAVAERLKTVERESLTATAEGEGLLRREALFAGRSTATTPENRRDALAALLQIDGDSLTPAQINHTLRGCGIRAKAQALDTGHLRVTFPDVGGEPPEFSRVRDTILGILPCHLDVEFYFRFLTWAECEQAGMTWASIEAAGHTWKSFELAVPEEV